MKFEPTEEQTGFAASLRALLEASDTSAASRAWAAGDPAPGLALWKRLADAGVCALAVPEEHDGLGASTVDLVVAFEELGRAAAPGPWIESAAYLPHLVADGAVLAELAGGALGSARVVGHAPCAVDGELAAHLYEVEQDGTVHTAATGRERRSVDPVRRLVEVAPGEVVAARDPDRAFDVAALACAATLQGLGEQLLSSTTAYLVQRTQFGRQIGSYQALKHAAADVRIALDFSRPLIHGAALALDGAGALPDADPKRDVSAAKVAAGDAAYRASRVALQLHGAIGYTMEYDLSLWILKSRALVSAWGTPSFHRGRVMSRLVEA